MTAETLLSIILFIGPALLGFFFLEHFFRQILKRIIAYINEYWYQEFDRLSFLDDKDANQIARSLTWCIYWSIYLLCIFLQFFFD